MHITNLALTLAAAASTALAKTAYVPPPMLAMKAAQADSGCTLPREFTVKNFAGATNNTRAKPPTLTSFEFNFSDVDTKIDTRCQFNSTSKSMAPEGQVARYACEDDQAQFIWVQDKSMLAMIEQVCPSDDGTPSYEASGSVIIPVSCSNKTSCAGNATEYSSIYVSLQPIRDMQSLQNMWED